MAKSKAALKTGQTVRDPSRTGKPVRRREDAGQARNVSVHVRSLVADDWAEVERLFGPRGACGGCWCMYWRLPRGGKLWDENKGEPNRRAFEKLVRGGGVYGCLAFVGEKPVGWCCVGPRRDFPRLERSRVLETDWSAGTWSVVCFYIAAGYRHRGVGSKLLRGAIAVAKAHGAREIEGYPVRPKHGSGAEIPAAFAWTGVEAMFESQGFTPLKGSSDSRAVYRKRFRTPAKR
ncbi:MAG: GNAT family N-acetyltransferase [Phycisphaerae bacterium]|nr:GNAT family N-acetyltransferase [Phycisphaerae bacterium]